jgi:eukaryotic-like serine/threonine-protein kinase
MRDPLKCCGMAGDHAEAPGAKPLNFGEYSIVGTVGQGGMGIVYDAIHRTTRRPVAIKTVNVLNRKMLAALRAEVLALRTVEHPCVVAILDDGLSEVIPWYAMERIEGASLIEFNRSLWGMATSKPFGSTTAPDSNLELRGVSRREAARTAWKPVNPRARPAAANGQLCETLRVYSQLCESLIHVHARGIVHRDLKPGNVVLRADNTPVLTDFGLASRRFGLDGRDTLDIASRFTGSRPYVSPEQIRGEIVDARADLYSFGCMLYETITGQPPFSGATTQEILEKHLHEAPVGPSFLVKELPPVLDSIITRLLAKQPKARVGHSEEILAALRECASDRVRPVRVSVPVDVMAQSYLHRPSFAGRRDALEQIAAMCGAAAAGRGRLAFIEGEAGIGKTFLAVEAARRARMEKVQVITGECAPPHTSTEGMGTEADAVPARRLRAFRGLFQTLADRCREDAPAAACRWLGSRGAVLAPYEPSLLPFVQAARVLEPQVASPEPSRGQLFDAMADTLRLLALEGPLLLVIDDLQWADELTCRFIESLSLEFFAATGVVVLGVYRIGEANPIVERLALREDVSHLTIGRLGLAEVASMVRDMLALPDPPEELVRFVYSHSGGNPFVAVEHVRRIATERIVQRRGGTSRRGGPQLRPTRAGPRSSPTACGVAASNSVTFPSSDS